MTTITTTDGGILIPQNDMHRIWFEGDWTDGKLYEGYINDYRWNGWVSPTVELSVAREIVRDQELQRQENPKANADNAILIWADTQPLTMVRYEPMYAMDEGDYKAEIIRPSFWDRLNVSGEVIRLEAVFSVGFDWCWSVAECGVCDQELTKDHTKDEAYRFICDRGCLEDVARMDAEDAKREEVNAWAAGVRDNNSTDDMITTLMGLRDTNADLGNEDVEDGLAVILGQAVKVLKSQQDSIDRQVSTIQAIQISDERAKTLRDSDQWAADGNEDFYACVPAGIGSGDSIVLRRYLEMDSTPALRSLVPSISAVTYRNVIEVYNDLDQDMRTGLFGNFVNCLDVRSLDLLRDALGCLADTTVFSWSEEDADKRMAL